MKAVTITKFGPPEEMTISEVSNPEIGENEILVRLHATALNRADLLQRQGKYPPPKGESEIMGLEMAGLVYKVGNKVTKWKEGDAVCGLLPGGGYAQWAKIHQDMAWPVPQGLSMEEAVAIPEVFLTAFQAIRWLADLQKGETLLIHAGASGVGTAAIQIAKTLGAQPMVTASKSKHDFCLKLGAVHAIDYKNEDFEIAARELTEGQGLHVIMDFIGGPYFQQNLNSLALDGRLVMQGFMGGPKLSEVNLAPILRRRLKVIGSTLRSRTLEYKIALAKDLYDFAWPLFESGELKPIIDSVFDWEEVVKAHRYMEANKNIGKIVLKVN
jgi:putative PIG3 family NAD(P)H quinone oxidoreductase